MPRTDGKPAGWKSAEGAFWLRNKDGVAQQKCKQCMRVSAEGCPPILAHERTCDEYPRESVVRGPDLPPRLTLGAVEQMRQELPEHPIDGVLRRSPLRAVRKPLKPVRYEAFKAFVRAKPCRLCGLSGPSDPHHFGPRGVSQKTSDLRLVPLCESDPRTGYEGHHDYYHRTGALPGMDPVGTAAWINESILELHDEFFGRWILGEDPEQVVADERLRQALDSAHEEI